MRLTFTGLEPFGRSSATGDRGKCAGIKFKDLAIPGLGTGEVERADRALRRSVRIALANQKKLRDTGHRDKPSLYTNALILTKRI